MNSIGKKAPQFYAKTTRGDIYFPMSRAGTWVVLYYYIGDFTPGSALDITELNRKVPKFKAYGTEIIGVSADSVPAHIAWALQMRNMDKDGKVIDIELVSDKGLEIARLYGISNTDTNEELNEKAVLIIDPSGIIRSFHRYSHGTGINVTEIEREVLALQAAAKHQALTPAGWTPGDDLVSRAPTTVSQAQSAIPDREAQGLICTDWYICYRRDAGPNPS